MHGLQKYFGKGFRVLEEILLGLFERKDCQFWKHFLS